MMNNPIPSFTYTNPDRVVHVAANFFGKRAKQIMVQSGYKIDNKGYFEDEKLYITVYPSLLMEYLAFNVFREMGREPQEAIEKCLEHQAEENLIQSVIKNFVFTSDMEQAA